MILPMETLQAETIQLFIKQMQTVSGKFMLSMGRPSFLPYMTFRPSQGEATNSLCVRLRIKINCINHSLHVISFKMVGYRRLYFFRYDIVTINETSGPFDDCNVEELSGRCPSPCEPELYGVSRSMISANGGQINLRFQSDSVYQYPGFWVEYNIGIEEVSR